MNIKVVANALIVKSSLTKSQVENAKHYCPDALTVTDQEGNDLYRVQTGDEASINPLGVIFNGATGDEGHLTATIVIPTVDDTRKYVKETYGLSLAALADYEGIISNEIDDTVGVVDTVMENFEVE